MAALLDCQGLFCWSTISIGLYLSRVFWICQMFWKIALFWICQAQIEPTDPISWIFFCPQDTKNMWKIRALLRPVPNKQDCGKNALYRWYFFGYKFGLLCTNQWPSYVADYLTCFACDNRWKNSICTKITALHTCRSASALYLHHY